MAACSSSNYGMVVKVDAKAICADIQVHIGTRNAGRNFYNERTSVEDATPG
jgi:hypothetical protein